MGALFVLSFALLQPLFGWNEVSSTKNVPCILFPYIFFLLQQLNFHPLGCSDEGILEVSYCLLTCRQAIASSQTTVLILWFGFCWVFFFPGIFIKWLYFGSLKDAKCVKRADVTVLSPGSGHPAETTAQQLPPVTFVLRLHIPHCSSTSPEVLFPSHLEFISALYWKPRKEAPVPSQFFPRLHSVHSDLKSMEPLT